MKIDDIKNKNFTFLENNSDVRFCILCLSPLANWQNPMPLDTLRYCESYDYPTTCEMCGSSITCQETTLIRVCIKDIKEKRRPTRWHLIELYKTFLTLEKTGPKIMPPGAESDLVFQECTGFKEPSKDTIIPEIFGNLEY